MHSKLHLWRINYYKIEVYRALWSHNYHKFCGIFSWGERMWKSNGKGLVNGKGPVDDCSWSAVPCRKNPRAIAGSGKRSRKSEASRETFPSAKSTPSTDPACSTTQIAVACPLPRKCFLNLLNSFFLTIQSWTCLIWSLYRAHWPQCPCLSVSEM